MSCGEPAQRGALAPECPFVASSSCRRLTSKLSFRTLQTEGLPLVVQETLETTTLFSGA